MAPAKRRTSDMAESPAKRSQIDNKFDAESVISLLRLPEGVQVARELANNNTTQTQVQAYAKLAGASWTFYVQSIQVVLGRRAVDSLDHVDIDLGPSKVVSRRHAILNYDLEQRRWVLDINGRNGVRVDCTSHKQGRVPLKSGNIIDIGGVQMMFVLPDVNPEINQTLLQNLINRKQPVELSNPQLSPSPGPAVIGLGVDGGTPTIQVPHQPSTLYPNGVAIVTRPQVREAALRDVVQDLSSDQCKDIKPPFSYATMISQAILSTSDSAMSLADIYQWISSHYSFYRHSKPGWQNSIRHNLSLNKAFEKVPRKENEPGKGSKWQITPKYREEFIKKANAGKLVKGRSQIQFQVRPKQIPEQALNTAQPNGEMTATHSTNSLHTQPSVQGPHSLPSHTPLPAPRGSAHHTQAPPQSQTLQMPIHPQVNPAAISRAGSELPAKEEEPLLPQPLNHSPTRGTPWLSRFTAPRLGEDQDRPYLELMEGDFVNTPQHLNISQLEAYTPDRGTSTRRTPLKSGSPAFWKYMHLNGTPLKGEDDMSPVRGKKDTAAAVSVSDGN